MTNPAPFCQAAFAVGAIKYTMPFVCDMYLHAYCNQDDNCSHYGTHKYVSDADHAKLNKLTNSQPGAGCFGYWRFKDGSTLFAMSNRSFVIYKPAQPDIDAAEKWYVEPKDPNS